jgi:hypothetical protein
MICIRVFSDLGVEKFRQYIVDLKNNLQTVKPDLNIEPYSAEFKPLVDIDENRIFHTKLEVAEYIKNKIDNAGIPREGILENRNLWTWLAYIWFEQLCQRKNGTLIPRETAKYICSSDYTDYYRHFIAAPFSIYSLYGRNNSRIFLHNKPYEHNDYIEQIASRQKIISHENLIVVLHRLYWDEISNRPKRGAQSRSGNHLRFRKIIDQFELTYNIYTMSPDEIINLLPDEFSQWK